MVQKSRTRSLRHDREPNISRPPRPNSVNKRYIIWPRSAENSKELFQPKYDEIEGQPQNNLNINFSSFFFFSRVRTHNSSKNATFSLFSFFPLSFLQQSCLNARADGFSQTGSRQPVRPHGRQLSLCFSKGLRAQGLMSHLIKAVTNKTMTWSKSIVFYCTCITP